MKHDHIVQGVTWAGISGMSTIAQIPMQDVSETGNLISILISIFSGVIALYKLLKKDKIKPV